jgi:hypothetical protein
VKLSPSRSPPSPCEAKRRRLASLAAAAHEHRTRLKMGFFNEIDVKRTSRVAVVDVAVGRTARLQGSPREGSESGREAYSIAAANDA